MKIILFFLSLTSSFVFAQNAFFKVFSSNGYDVAHGVAQLADSSYFVTGSSSSFQDNDQAFLMKLDKEGNFKWSKDYGGSESEIARRVFVVPNSGVYLFGYGNSTSDGNFDAFVLKTDMNGNLLWNKNYGGNGWEKIMDAKPTVDSGFIFVGQTFSTNNESGNVYIVRINKHGDTLWTKNWGGSGDDIANTIISKNDTSFYIGGKIFEADSLMDKGFLMQIDTSGNILDVDTLGSFGNYEINDLQKDVNKIVALGWGQKPFQNKHSGLIFNLDFNGNVVNEDLTFNGNNYQYNHICMFGPSNSFYFNLSLENASPVFKNDQYVAMYYNGLWWGNAQMNLVFEEEDEAHDLISTNDGGAVMVGAMKQFSVGGSNAYLVKIGPNTTYPAISALPPVEPLLTVNSIEDIPGLQIYPNPMHETLTLKDESASTYEVLLMNTTGEVLMRFLKNDALETISVAHLSSGMYLLKGIRDQIPFTKVLVKQ